MDYKNEYFTENVGEKIYPESILNLSKLTLSTPEVMAVFSGLQLVIGEDILYLHKVLLDATEQIVPICSKLQTERENLELREKDMRASLELLERKKEVILGRLKETESLNEEYRIYLNKLDAEGMSVCAKMLVSKYNDTENDSIECKAIKREYEKYADIFNDCSTSYNELKTISDEATKSFNEKINELSVKNLDTFNAFIQMDESVFEKIIQSGVKSVNENLSEQFGGKIESGTVLSKTKFVLTTLSGFYKTVSEVVGYLKSVFLNGELNFSAFDTKKAKRYLTIVENYNKFIQSVSGVQYALNVLPAKLKKEHTKALDLFDEILKIHIEEGGSTKSQELEDTLLSLAKKNQDSMLLGLFGVVNELKMYSLSVSTKNILAERFDDEDLVHQLLSEADTKRLFD